MRAPAVLLAALAVLGLAGTLAGCQPDSPAAGIGIEEPWIRAVPPNAAATAGYFVLQNGSGEHLVLQAVTVAGIPRAEIHDTTMTDGVMRMRRLDSVTIRAGETATFAPGGRHLMLFADSLPAAGSTVTVQLAFADGRVLAFEAPVRRGAD